MRVLRGGPLTLFQDLGRWGFQRHGVPVGGAMDEVSARVANLLVGNAPGEAVLEITLQGPSLVFDSDCLVALCGARFAVHAGGCPVLPDRPVRLAAGTVLEIGAAAAGCRGYLALAGGWALEPVLGSCSTFAPGGFGGWLGRGLRRGDQVPVRGAEATRLEGWSAQPGQTGMASPRWSVRPPVVLQEGRPARVRFLPGLHWNAFPAQSRKAFTTQRYRVGARSDAMGCRLEGLPLPGPDLPDLPSAGVTYGTLQVPPDGQPIVLMAHRHTTGGYPRLGEVIAADLPLLAQMRPGDTLGFDIVTTEEAESLYRRREAAMQALEQAIVMQEKQRRDAVHRPQL